MRYDITYISDVKHKKTVNNNYLQVNAPISVIYNLLSSD
jgi:hypothetical protein